MDLLLVTLDTVRADHLGCYGGAASTPAIDALCAKGVVFEDASTTVPLTLPSHVALLSGLDPDRTGVRSNHDVLPSTLSLGVDALRAHGWTAGAFVSGRPLVGSTGLAAHFDPYDDAMPDALAGPRAPAERRGDHTVAAALDWWRATPSPRFLWVHLYDAHRPWTPTTGRGYDAELADVDRAVGTLLAGVGAGTTVVLVADHGEALGDHGEQEHGIFLYQATIHVPLVVAAPGVAPKRVSTPVSTLDVMPTLLARAGLPEDLPGVDLLGTVPADRALFAGTTFPLERYGWAPLRSVRREPLVAVDAPVPELYDLRADPGETRNLAPSRAEDLANLLALLPPVAPAAPRSEDEAQREALAALGYVDGGSSPPSPPDPKSRAKLLAPLLQAQDAIYAGDPARAAKILEDVVAQDPTNAAALNDLGLSDQALNLHERALAVLTRAAALAPQDPAIWSNVGVSAAHLGHLDDARHAYDEAARLAPGNAAPCVNRAVLELRAGDRDAARHWAEEALRREPGLQAAKDVLAQLPPPEVPP